MSGPESFQPRLVGFLCNWCCYAGADLAGVSRYQYPPYIRIIRLMCSGRVDARFVLHAFGRGADGVFIGGCWLGECHYVTEGNYDALSMLHLVRGLLRRSGVDPRRLRLEWVSASEGIRFAEVMTDFGRQLQQLGPLGRSEGLSAEELGWRLRAALALVPYLKLVERERLRVSFRTDQQYREFFESPETEKLVSACIDPELRLQQLVQLVGEKPLGAGDIAHRLKLSPAETAATLRIGLRRGLVDYDAESGRYGRVTAGRPGL